MIDYKDRNKRNWKKISLIAHFTSNLSLYVGKIPIDVELLYAELNKFKHDCKCPEIKNKEYCDGVNSGIMLTILAIQEAERDYYKALHERGEEIPRR